MKYTPWQDDEQSEGLKDSNKMGELEIFKMSAGRDRRDTARWKNMGTCRGA